MARQASSTGLQPLAPALTKVLRQAGLDRVMLLARLTQHWEKIAGAQIASVAQPEHIRSRILFITVADAIWLQQITFYQTQLLRNIRRVLGDVPLGKLHFVLHSAPTWLFGRPCNRRRRSRVSSLYRQPPSSQMSLRQPIPRLSDAINCWLTRTICPTCLP